MFKWEYLKSPSYFDPFPGIYSRVGPEFDLGIESVIVTLDSVFIFS